MNIPGKGLNLWGEELNLDMMRNFLAAQLDCEEKKFLPV